MSNRELVIDLVNKMPENAPLEDIAEKIRFVAGVNKAIEQADRGGLLSLEEVDQLVEKWATESK